MKDQETIARFIHLRATGLSYDKISGLRAEVSREVGEIRFSAATRHLPSDEYFEEVLDWQV
jgi:hypothetical protein